MSWWCERSVRQVGSTPRTVVPKCTGLRRAAPGWRQDAPPSGRLVSGEETLGLSRP